MTVRRHLRRVLNKWVWTAALACAIGAHLASGWRLVAVQRAVGGVEVIVALVSGGVVVWTDPYPKGWSQPTSGWHFAVERAPTAFSGGRWDWWVRHRRSSSADEWFVPLWPLVGVLGVATLVSWRRTRRGRFVAGCCEKCGYELSGLAPGAVCPECGGMVKT